MLLKAFGIGDIVALKSHPYFQQHSNILIAGDPQHLPPLMVVTEVYFRHAKFNADGPDEITAIEYNCIWFSSKEEKFVSAWFNQELLKLIEVSQGTSEISIADHIVLKTIDLELGKRKSTFSVRENQEYNTITSLLTYLPPIMQVVGIFDYASKHALKDKNQRIIRHVPEKIIKCKWYHFRDNKLSEVEIPIESIRVIPQINPEILESIQEAIDKTKVYQISYKGCVYLVRPESICFKAGYYNLTGYDYIDSRGKEFNILEIDNVKSVELAVNQAPRFDIDTKHSASTIIDEILKAINRASENGAYIRIKYKNRNDEVSVRTVEKYKIETIEVGEEKIVCLVGYCKLRKEKRIFRIDRIQTFQELNLLFRTS